MMLPTRFQLWPLLRRQPTPSRLRRRMQDLHSMLQDRSLAHQRQHTVVFFDSIRREDQRLHLHYLTEQIHGLSTFSRGLHDSFEFRDWSTFRTNRGPLVDFRGQKQSSAIGPHSGPIADIRLFSAGFVPPSGPIAGTLAFRPPGRKAAQPGQTPNPECSDLPAHDLDLIWIEIHSFDYHFPN